MHSEKAQSQITIVPSLITYSFIEAGAFNSRFPSALYVTPYSSVHALDKSSSVTFVERLSFSFWNLIGFEALMRLTETRDRLF